MDTEPASALAHHVDGGINYLTILRADREAVDEFVALLETLITDGLRTAPESAILMVIDVGKSGLPPIRYAYERGLDLSRRIETSPPICLAIVVRDRLMISLIGNIINDVVGEPPF